MRAKKLTRTYLMNVHIFCCIFIVLPWKRDFSKFNYQIIQIQIWTSHKKVIDIDSLKFKLFEQVKIHLFQNLVIDFMVQKIKNLKTFEISSLGKHDSTNWWVYSPVSKIRALDHSRSSIHTPSKLRAILIHLFLVFSMLLNFPNNFILNRSNLRAPFRRYICQQKKISSNLFLSYLKLD